MSEPFDKNVRDVRKLLADRAEIGLCKYGATTERTDLSRLDWLRHAQAEALDFSVYLQRLISDEEHGLRVSELIIQRLNHATLNGPAEVATAMRELLEAMR